VIYDDDCWISPWYTSEPDEVIWLLTAYCELPCRWDCHSDRNDIGYLQAKRVYHYTPITPQKVVLVEIIGTHTLVECVPGSIFVLLDAAPLSQFKTGRDCWT